MIANATNDAADSRLPNCTFHAKQGATVISTLSLHAALPISFSLKPGTYTFNEVCPSVGAGDEPWRQSKPTPNSDAAADCGTGTYTETLTSNGSKTGNDFGNYRNGRKSGRSDERRVANGAKCAGGSDVPKRKSQAE